MQQQIIYEVRVSYIGSLNELRKREPFVVYFSNLKKTMENITGQLALNGWPVKINYIGGYKLETFFIKILTWRAIRFLELRLQRKR
jgi:hypothetical protein